jgi:hypothetical protein
VESRAELDSIQALHLERALSQVFKKCQFDVDAEAGQNQIVSFGYAYYCRCDQWSLFGLQDLGDLGVAAVGAGRLERPCIE